MASYPLEILPTIHNVISLLVAGKYLELEMLSGGIRLSASEIEGAVKTYGRNICLPPVLADALIDAVELNVPGIFGWSVFVPLWTIEEGRSDLTLACTLLALPNGSFKVEIDDIHVL